MEERAKFQFDSNNSELVNYMLQGFKLPIVRNGVKTYASVNEEMYSEEDGLAPTGNYFVYLLDPAMGSTYFTLEPFDDSVWVSRDAPQWVGLDIIKEISDKIGSRLGKDIIDNDETN